MLGMTAWGTRTVACMGAVLAVALAACGARTEMVDPAAVGISSSEPGPVGGASGPAAAAGAATAGSAPQGGAPATSTPGSPAIGGVGGSTSVGSGDPRALPICAKYCSATTVTSCPGGLASFGTCFPDCISQVSSFPQCEELAAALVDCFVAAGSADSEQCSALKTPANCAMLEASYKICSGSLAPSEPIIAPPPSPPPMCASAASGDGQSCSLDQKCNDGSYYSVYCKPAGPEQSFCICTSNQGVNASFDLNERGALACSDAHVVCGLPD